MPRQLFNPGLVHMEVKERNVPACLNGTVLADYIPYEFTSGFLGFTSENGVPAITEYCYLPSGKYPARFCTDPFFYVLSRDEAALLLSQGLGIHEYVAIGDPLGSIQLYHVVTKSIYCLGKMAVEQLGKGHASQHAIYME